MSDAGKELIDAIRAYGGLGPDLGGKRWELWQKVATALAAFEEERTAGCVVIVDTVSDFGNRFGGRVAVRQSEGVKWNVGDRYTIRRLPGAEEGEIEVEVEDTGQGNATFAARKITAPAWDVYTDPELRSLGMGKPGHYAVRPLPEGPEARRPWKRPGKYWFFPCLCWNCGAGCADQADRCAKCGVRFRWPARSFDWLSGLGRQTGE